MTYPSWGAMWLIQFGSYFCVGSAASPWEVTLLVRQRMQVISAEGGCFSIAVDKSCQIFFGYSLWCGATVKMVVATATGVQVRALWASCISARSTWSSEGVGEAGSNDRTSSRFGHQLFCCLFYLSWNESLPGGKSYPILMSEIAFF